MIKICILGSDGMPGGVTNYLFNLINFTNDTSINYIIFSENKKFFKKNIKSNFKFVNFKINYNFLNLFSIILSLKKKLIVNKIKIIHAHTQRAAFIACLMKYLFLLKDLKIIYTPHGFRHSQLFAIKHFFHLLFEKFILSKINHIILISENELNVLKSFKQFQVPKTFIKTAIPKILYKKSISLKRDLKIKRSSKIILMCGSVQKIKQPNLFIDIATKLLKGYPDTFFIWLGKKIDKTKKYDKSRIKFIGNIDDKLKYYSFMKCADIFLMTSKIETFPLSILEAKKIGLKIVCNNFKGANKILKKSDSEYLFRYNDADNAVKILKKILSKNKLSTKNSFLHDDNSINLFCKKHRGIYQLIGQKNLVY